MTANLPWTIELDDTNAHLGWSIRDARGMQVATVYANIVHAPRPEAGEAADPENAPSIETARLIVRAVNCHEELGGALREAKSLLPDTARGNGARARAGDVLKKAGG